MSALPLRSDTLAHHAGRVAVPTYDRASLAPSVVHMSVGSFHRSHQAMYFDELAERRVSGDWGLIGVGLHRPQMREVLSAQDGLYTVVSRGPARDQARVVGAVVDYRFAPADGEGVVRALATEGTRVVTLTITARGYEVDAQEAARHTRPATAVGYLVDALDRRRRAGLPGFTVISCDNVADNGKLARAAVVALAAARDDRLAQWIERNVAFPSSMVDRITPKTSPADRDWVEREFGVADRWPVITEPFSQWIIADEFCNERPPLDEVGAQFVSDVRPYSLMKTRLLNASHCALGYLGSQASYARTDEVIADPVFREYTTRLMGHEVTPLLPPVPGIDLPHYRQTLLGRLANPKIGDRLARLCRNGSGKVPNHVVGSIAEARAAGRPHPLLTLALAGWIRHLGGAGDVPVDDPLAGRLEPLARAGGTDPRPLLGERDLFGSLGDDEAFAINLEHALEALDRDGVRAAVAAACADAQALAA